MLIGNPNVWIMLRIPISNIYILHFVRLKCYIAREYDITGVDEKHLLIGTTVYELVEL